ncbi:hypothetical protein GCM10011357_37010 [Lacimicrobium alkaliphilum]|uniref:Uncharacterized protein n=1 Tax=Lacimicrobium alkaliphilum TaxID=1526571 RepID=A0ABQ1RQR1_9ALTE|nr:hypothetical protein GCM10011357_37010 [Lacimicrobium alkaliphilum]
MIKIQFIDKLNIPSMAKMANSDVDGKRKGLIWPFNTTLTSAKRHARVSPQDEMYVGGRSRAQPQPESLR